MPTLVLATKLFPPTPRSELVARPGLAEQLDSTLSRSHRLTLISAPAGFGKSTLLSDWAARRADADVVVAWLSLDEADNTVSRFLAHLWAALAGGGLDLGAEELDALGGAPTSAVMTAVVNELELVGRRRPDRDRARTGPATGGLTWPVAMRLSGRPTRWCSSAPRVTLLGR